jgi:hypothetical protein
MKSVHINISGFDVLIDEEDKERVLELKWHRKYVENNKYFTTTVRYEGKKHQNQLSLHRFIMNDPKGIFVDHINGNNFDNRKSNLRLATPGENARNINPINYKGNIRGITIRNYGRSPRYEVKIKSNGKTINIGTYDNIMVAEYHLMKACNKYHGDFSRYARHKNEWINGGKDESTSAI